MSTNTGTPTASLTANNSAGEDSTTNKSGRSSFARLSSGLDLPASQKALQRRASFSVRQQMPNFKFSDALEKAENGGGEEHDSLEDLRLRTKKFMTHSVVGHYYEDIMLVISVISTFEFIFETYLEPANKFNNEAQSHLHKVDFFFGAAFAFDWCLNFLLADRKYQFVLSFFAMVDMMTVVSIFGTFGHQEPDYDEVASAISVVMYILFLLKTTRVLRSLRVMNKLDYIEDAVDRFIGVISLSISVMILFFASVMQFLEKSTLPHPFHTWMYYIWVTISTVGYGDITPITPVGRFAAMAMIGFAIISVPKMTNELIEKMNLQSVYARAVYNPKSKSSRHIVICGDLSSTSLADFFEELFHEDHENADLSAVILLPSPPTVEILLMLRSSKYILSMSYLQGSALVDADLKRAKAETAEALFIMTNKFSSVPDEEDAKSVLQNLSIKRYLSSARHRSDPLYCMQLIRPENLRQLSANNANHELEENNLVVCLNEIKMGVLARAVVYPGANTFIMNLITSFSEDSFVDDNNDDSAGSELVHDATTGKMISLSSNAWLKEYQKGCDWEIYTTSLSDIFVGAKFSELSLGLYEKLGVVLFALQITHLKKKEECKLLLNPAHFVIPEKSSNLKVEAFVLAKNKQSSDLSFVGKGQHDHNAFHAMAEGLSGLQGGLQSITNVIKSSVTDQFADNLVDRRKSSAVTPGMLASNSEDDSSRQESTSGKVLKKSSKWNSLKRSALLDKKVQSFSYQEVLQRMEDEHFTKYYYLRATAVELADATVKTAVIDEIPFINNHIIVIGKELSNLYDLIKPLRAKYLGALRYIVILYPYDIPYDVWQRISMFDAILIVRGSPLEESNLRRAGIFRAQQVVVLAEGSTSSSEASGMEALVDSDAIFAYQCVKRMNPNTQVVVEIVNQSNIGYLVTDIQGSTDANDYKFSNQFAAGTLFTTSLLDSLVCQAYYNPHIIKVVNKLISGVDQMERAGLQERAQAEVMESQGQENADPESDEDDDEDEVHDTTAPSNSDKAKRKRRNTVNEIKGSCLYQIPVPDAMVKKTYGALYQHLAMQGIIPLGLLRGTLSNLNIGPKSNKMPYVYTNPDKTAELYHCDRIFVLALTPQSTTGKTNVKDWLLDIQMQKNREKESGKPGGSVVAGGLRPQSAAQNMESLSTAQKKLEDKFNKLSGDVNKKFNSIVSLLKAVITHMPGTEDVNFDELLESKLQNREKRGMSTDTNSNSIVSGKDRRFSVDSATSFMTRDTDSGTEFTDDKIDSQQTERAKLQQAKKDRLELKNNTNENTVGSSNGNNSAPPPYPTSSPTMYSASPNGILRKMSKTGDAIPANQKKRHSFSDPVVSTVTLIQPLTDYSEHSEEKEGSVAEAAQFSKHTQFTAHSSQETFTGLSESTSSHEQQGDKNSDSTIEEQEERDREREASPDGFIYSDNEVSEKLRQTPERSPAMSLKVMSSGSSSTGKAEQMSSPVGFDSDADAQKDFVVKRKPEPKTHVRPHTSDGTIHARKALSETNTFTGPPIFLATAAEQQHVNTRHRATFSGGSPRQRIPQYQREFDLSNDEYEDSSAAGNIYVGNRGTVSSPNVLFTPSQQRQQQRGAQQQREDFRGPPLGRIQSHNGTH